MLQRLLFIMSVTSATSGVLADGEQGDARGGKQHNGHTVRCDGRTGVGGGSSRGTGLVTGSGCRNLNGGGLGTGYSANSLDRDGLASLAGLERVQQSQGTICLGSERLGYFSDLLDVGDDGIIVVR